MEDNTQILVDLRTAREFFIGGEERWTSGAYMRAYNGVYSAIYFEDGRWEKPLPYFCSANICLCMAGIIRVITQSPPADTTPRANSAFKALAEASPFFDASKEPLYPAYEGYVSRMNDSRSTTYKVMMAWLDRAIASVS